MRLATTHWKSDRFPDEYVTALRRQACPHDLTVLGNGCDCDAPLRTELTGWNSKLEWFAPWNAALRPAVVFDLDTYLVGDMTPFLEFDTKELALIEEFLGPPAKRKAESGVFVAPDNDDLCARIWARAQNWTGPDGHLMRQFPHRLLPRYIDGIYSYKGHRLQEGYPDDARVICFHGVPKPPQTDGWALDRWRRMTA